MEELTDLATVVEIGIMAVISEVAEEIYRINVELPGKPVTVSMFVIDESCQTNCKGRQWWVWLRLLAGMTRRFTLNCAALPPGSWKT